MEGAESECRVLCFLRWRMSLRRERSTNLLSRQEKKSRLFSSSCSSSLFRQGNGCVSFLLLFLLSLTQYSREARCMLLGVHLLRSSSHSDSPTFSSSPTDAPVEAAEEQSEHRGTTLPSSTLPSPSSPPLFSSASADLPVVSSLSSLSSSPSFFLSESSEPLDPQLDESRHPPFSGVLHGAEGAPARAREEERCGVSPENRRLEVPSFLSSRARQMKETRRASTCRERQRSPSGGNPPTEVALRPGGPSEVRDRERSAGERRERSSPASSWSSSDRGIDAQHVQSDTEEEEEEEKGKELPKKKKEDEREKEGKLGRVADTWLCKEDERMRHSNSRASQGWSRRSTSSTSGGSRGSGGEERENGGPDREKKDPSPGSSVVGGDEEDLLSSPRKNVDEESEADRCGEDASGRSLSDARQDDESSSEATEKQQAPPEDFLRGKEGDAHGLGSPGDHKKKEEESDGGKFSSLKRRSFADVEVSERDLGDAQRALLERTMLCSDLDESPEMCEAHPRCTYRGSRTSETAADRVGGQRRNEGSSDEEDSDFGRFASPGKREKGMCVLDGDFVKHQVRDECMMIPKGTALAIARDLHREGFIRMGPAVISHLRSRGDPMLLCRAITHSYFSSPRVQLHHLLQDEKKEDEEKMLHTSERRSSSSSTRAREEEKSAGGSSFARGLKHSRKSLTADNASQSSGHARRENDESGRTNPRLTDSTSPSSEERKEFDLPAESFTGGRGTEIKGERRRRRDEKAEGNKKEETGASWGGRPAKNAQRNGEGAREEEALASQLRKHLAKLDEKPWKQLEPWEKLVRILH